MPSFEPQPQSWLIQKKFPFLYELNKTIDQNMAKIQRINRLYMNYRSDTACLRAPRGPQPLSKVHLVSTFYNCIYISAPSVYAGPFVLYIGGMSLASVSFIVEHIHTRCAGRIVIMFENVIAFMSAQLLC